MKPLRLSKLVIYIYILAAFLCLPALAYGDSARVVTPGGKLNMRKSPKANAKLAAYIPNHSLVEVEEVGQEWSQIVYNSKSGYVKTEFLRIASQLPGQTVYADKGTLLLMEEADAASPIIRPISGLEAIEVLALEENYALACVGEDTGYVAVSGLSYQHQEPAAQMEWISQPGLITEACPLRAGTAASDKIIGTLALGDEVTVTIVEGDYCLVLSDLGCGYAPTAAICLTGPEDSEDTLDGLTPMEAVSQGMNALKKEFKAFDDEPLYYQIAVIHGQNGLEEPLYACGFFNDQNQYLYGAWVNASTKKVAFLASYSGFAIPSDNVHLLPAGEAALALSANSLPVGGILDVTVTAWTNHQCQYTLYKDGKEIFSGEVTDHFEASYRPRSAGVYTLTVTIEDRDGVSVSVSEEFTVQGEVSNVPLAVYSQKDGWWLDKQYRKSNLDQSGCAIFALSHALNRLGVTSQDALPAQLAQTFSLCLTADGTNNERLLREASQIYGFETARDLIESKKKIGQLLQEGCMFSFSVARGHIAMISGISDDGAMVRVVDSAPSATFERLVNASIYYQTRSGSWRIASSLADIPMARWYFETDNYGGLEYWMTLDYAARRRVRLIRP
ncbi:MAG: hypothetical protein IJ461_03840 [Clostridia bacterium]|nr:hypothetical protein [Clostridia bacterium]